MITVRILNPNMFSVKRVDLYSDFEMFGVGIVFKNDGTMVVETLIEICTEFILNPPKIP